jgi:hypothetical protein
MKTLTMATVLAMLVCAAACATAQTTSVFVGYSTNGTTVKILNATDDNALIGPVLDGQQDRQLTPRGKMFQRHYTNAMGILNGPQKIDWQVYGCRNEHQALPGTFYNPPEWTADTTYLGGLAITQDYIAGNPNEDRLRERVDSIENLLNGRRELGRKDKINELKAWYKSVKKTSLKVQDQICGNPQIITGTLTVSDWYGHHTILITVRGSAANGFTTTVQ